MPDPNISGGEVSDVSLHFANHNPPPFQVWLSNIFPADPPNLDWTELKGIPPRIYRDELGADSGRLALLEKTYNYDLIRKYYIISRQCSNINPDTGKVLDSQLKALADNFLMDAYLHWNFTPIQIMELKNGKHETDAFLLTSEKNKKTASNSDVVFCQVTDDTNKSEIEILANSRKQVLSYASDLSRLQSNLLEMQNTITTLQQDKIDTEQQYKIFIMQLQSKIDEVDKIKNAAIDQATRDVSALVAEKTFDLQKQNDKLFAELKQSHDALLVSRTQLNIDYDKRVGEIERTEKALCAQSMAELKVTHEQYKSKIKTALETKLREFDEKEKRLDANILEKEAEIIKIKNTLSSLIQKSDNLNKSNEGMKELLNIARSELQTKSNIISELKSALQKISINAEEKVEQLLASKVSAMEARTSLEMQAKNSKINDLERRLSDKSVGECTSYTDKINKQQQEIAQLYKTVSDKDEAIRQLTDAMKQLKGYLQYRDKSEAPSVPSRRIMGTAEMFGMSRRRIE